MGSGGRGEAGCAAWTLGRKAVQVLPVLKKRCEDSKFRGRNTGRQRARWGHMDQMVHRVRSRRLKWLLHREHALLGCSAACTQA